nr:MAG TPA: hypothetical protein [Caudoviricetes sp.]
MIHKPFVFLSLNFRRFLSAPACLNRAKLPYFSSFEWCLSGVIFAYH